ncbi:RNA-binding domain-containing protein [Porphyromonas sp.]
MKEQELQDYIKSTYPRENEQCDWKEASNLKHFVKGHEGEDIVSYVSAFANMEGGHLVLGISNQNFEIRGIQDKATFTPENLKQKLLEHCTNLPSVGLSVEEFTTSDSMKCVWIIHIPRHEPRLPVYAHRTAWQRNGDSLTQLLEDRRRRILDEVTFPLDWSAELVNEARYEDLSHEAIKRARVEFAKRNPNRSEEMQQWSDARFLDKAKLTIRGKITRSALLLLGTPESAPLLNPSVAQIRWLLKDSSNNNKDHEVFGPPFLLAIEELHSKIRNIKYRYVRPNSLFPEEMLRYDPFSIRELVCNCIAHQDYLKCERIDVVEYEDDKLIFRNAGSFIPRSVEDVIINDCPEAFYRNRFLVEAMRNLNMIETEGGGIKKVFNKQRDRGFPMPEYDLSEEHVRVTLIGKVINEDFAKLLLSQTNTLSLADVLLLDKVQKQIPISIKEAQSLKQRNLIEGRRPRYFLSQRLTGKMNDPYLKVEYIKHKGLDDRYYQELIQQYLRAHGSASRQEINNLLMNKLPDLLSKQQKENRISYLLQRLKQDGLIKLGAKKRWFPSSNK